MVTILGLAIFAKTAHVLGMASQPDSSSRNQGKGKKVLGRSAATGRYVMAPKSHRGSITVKEANTAAKHVTIKKR